MWTMTKEHSENKYINITKKMDGWRAGKKGGEGESAINLAEFRLLAVS